MEVEEEAPPQRPRALPDEVVEQILLRSPADDPATLVRAALVCKPWSRLVSAHDFRGRFRDRAGHAPMLGFLRNDLSQLSCPGAAPYVSVRLVHTTASCPPPLAVTYRFGWHALDARAGRVLLSPHVQTGRSHNDAEAPVPIRLAVWDPLAGRHQDLPVPVLPHLPYSWNAALLCDHLMDGPFRVLLVGTDAYGVFACTYASSATASAWSEPQQLGPGPGGGDHVDEAPAALAGNVLYFLFRTRTRVLRYDLGTRDMSVVHLPPAWRNKRMVLTTTEDGGLGFARMEGYKLCIWSMSIDPNGNGGVLEPEPEPEWTQVRVIDLKTLLPVINLLGFAHGTGTILVGTIRGFFSVNQRSGRIRKLADGLGFHSVVPYLSFYAPPITLPLPTPQDQ